MISSSALSHRQFRNFLEDNGAEIADLPKLHSVRWLSCEKVFNNFFKIFDLVQEYVFNKFGQEEFPELSDPSFLQKLAFFSDITKHLGNLNRSLQGEQLNFWESFKKIGLFKEDIATFVDEIKSKNFQNFPNLSILCTENIDLDFQTIKHWLLELKDDFDRRFQDFVALKPLMIFGNDLTAISNEDLESVCKLVNADYSAAKSEMSKYKIELTLVKDAEYKILSEKSQVLSLILAKARSIFSSSYKCEQGFSKMNYILSETRSSLTQQNLANALVVCTTKLDFDLEKIVVENKYRCSE